MRLVVGATACALAVLARPARAEDTQRYVVEAGDTCIGIAIRVLGDRAAWTQIHRLNPQLGPTPHRLAPGTVLVLPVVAQGPDARLTRARGDVKIRKPSADAWDAAERGAELFRAYRVGSGSHASAEMRFADDALLAMRERTIVVIYGPEKRLAKVIAATAELAEGTLESRLGELDGKTLVVRTPAGEADLRAGDVILAAGRDGAPSVLSNHRGAPVELRGRNPGRSRVKVAAGMGTRVAPGKPPEPPRPLPPAPVWVSPPGPMIATSNGTLILEWRPAIRAARYRVAVREPSGELIAARVVATPATTLELALAPGPYEVTVAAIDADGLESVPSPGLAIERIAPAFLPPSGRVPRAGAATPRAVVLGTTIVAAGGTTCSSGGAFQPRLVLAQPGTVSVRCKDPGGHATPPLALDVVALAGPPRVASAASRPAPRPPIWRGEVGAYTGFHTVAVRGPIDLISDRARALDDGPTLGARGGIYRRRRFGVEAELGVSMLDRLAASSGDGGAVLALGLHGALRHDAGATSLRVLGGLGLTSVLDDAGRSLVAGWSWGGAALLDIRGIAVRVDLRHQVAAGYAGVAHALQATLGASIDLPH